MSDKLYMVCDDSDGSTKRADSNLNEEITEEEKKLMEEIKKEYKL